MLLNQVTNIYYNIRVIYSLTLIMFSWGKIIFFYFFFILENKVNNTSNSLSIQSLSEDKKIESITQLGQS
jgi:hypothetical protein